MNRCHNKSSDDYSDYGGRGIFVCERWHDVANFIEDMGERTKGASIDRIDNERGYEHGNCRWSNPTEQANNKRCNRRYKYDGKDMTIAQWERELGFSRGTLWARISKGVPFEKAISQ